MGGTGESVPRRYAACGDDCTVDCGHCKGAGHPGEFVPAQITRGGAEVGDLAVHTSGDVVVLDRRKDDDTGWWLDRPGGLADFALAGPDWVLVKRYVARDALSKGWRRPHVDSWQAGPLAECEGGSRHEITAVHIIVRAECGAAFMSTDGGIALHMAAEHSQQIGRSES